MLACCQKSAAAAGDTVSPCTVNAAAGPAAAAAAAPLCKLLPLLRVNLEAAVTGVQGQTLIRTDKAQEEGMRHNTHTWLPHNRQPGNTWTRSLGRVHRAQAYIPPRGVACRSPAVGPTDTNTITMVTTHLPAGSPHDGTGFTHTSLAVTTAHSSCTPHPRGTQHHWTGKPSANFFCSSKQPCTGLL